MSVSPWTEEFDAKGKDQILVGKGLRKTYDGERYQFKDVDLSLNSGQRVAIVGPNGRAWQIPLATS